jgi:methyl-accepting chemotaxis protein
MSQSISAATEEQTTNAKQVAKAIENVNELTQQAASSAEEMSAATEELSTLAQQMQRLVEQFRLSEEGGKALPEPQAPRSGGSARGTFVPVTVQAEDRRALKKRLDSNAA